MLDEGIQRRAPERAVAVEPGLELLEAGPLESVATLLSDGRGTDQSRLPQHP
ncbi:MAG: hypothetical protein WKF47_07665 [Geodermatophilaceae bacterium]